MSQIQTPEGLMLVTAARLANTSWPAGVEPIDRGLLAWTYDPALAVSSGSPTSGIITGGRVKHPGGVVTNIVFVDIAPLVGGIPGQNLAGIYDANGNLLAQTGDMTTQWSTTGQQTCALTAPINLAAQFLDIVVLAVQSGGITPAVCRVNGAAGQYNAGAAGIPFRAFTADTATSLPAVLGAKTVRTTPEWLALS